jgi:hypothetical protein
MSIENSEPRRQMGVNLTERKAAAQASVKMATMSAISRRVHDIQVMAFTPALFGEQEKAVRRYVMDVTMRSAPPAVAPVALADRIVIGSQEVVFVN